MEKRSRGAARTTVVARADAQLATAGYNAALSRPVLARGVHGRRGQLAAALVREDAAHRHLSVVRARFGLPQTPFCDQAQTGLDNSRVDWRWGGLVVTNPPAPPASNGTRSQSSWQCPATSYRPTATTVLPQASAITVAPRSALKARARQPWAADLHGTLRRTKLLLEAPGRCRRTLSLKRTRRGTR